MDALLPQLDTNVELTLKEVVDLGADDSIFFAKTFFPNTVRQKSPKFHHKMWELIDNPSNRLVNLQVFRGGAKTTQARLFAAKRIAYGLAHTILYIGKSEGHAVRSVRWLKQQVTSNSLFANTFQLSKGSKWQDVEVEIIHGIDEYPIWIMAMGITGSVRGINQDDFRPDLIVIDDVLDEENSATVEQRQKIEALIYGALKESLAPVSEAPDAKMFMIQTPLNREDASTKALTDPEWVSAKFGCFTEATANLPIELQESAWPERWTSNTLRKEKEAAITRNQLSIWLREKECKITSPETSSFLPDWLRYYDILPELNTKVIVIDPVPPPSEKQIAIGLKGKDFECFAVVAAAQGNFYLDEYITNRGHDPEWTIATFFSLWMKHHPRETLVEAVAYQRTLLWILTKAMKVRRQYPVIKPLEDDKRSKFNKIVDGLSGPASNGVFYIRREHTEFIQQFTEYPDVSHDDIIESVAIGVDYLNNDLITGSDADDLNRMVEEEKHILPITYGERAP